jgi:glutathione S-transferase
MNDLPLVFFHNPQSRSAGVRVLLEALQIPYQLRFIDLKRGDQRQPEFLAINPMGKLPTILHGDVVVTEQVAIYLYLADRFADAGLAPAIDDPLRGTYLRWMVFYGASFEPAVVDHAMTRPDIDASTAPYGSYDGMLDALSAQLDRGKFVLGDRFSAADVLWGSALRWTTGFGIVPLTPTIGAYIERACAHPAFARAAALDAEMNSGG